MIRNPVTNHFIDRSKEKGQKKRDNEPFCHLYLRADGFRKLVIVQRRGVSTTFDSSFMDDAIYVQKQPRE